MRSVAIIGAGITGLTAAFYLKRAGIPVSVYEMRNRAGGAIQSIRHEGYLAESGPNTILETSPRITQLILDVGLASRRIETNPASKTRYLVRYKRPIAMPDSVRAFLTTDLFSLRAKLAFFREPFVPARRGGPEESIADFVSRRICPEFLDYAVDALVGGIYAGDPVNLSVRHAFPKLQKLEEEYGSLVKGQLLGARKRKRSGEIAKNSAQAFSFDEGLEVLPKRLCEILADSIHLNTSINRITQTSSGWSLELRDGERVIRSDFSAVLYAGTAFNLAELPIECATSLERTACPDELRRTDFSPFSEIRHPPVSSVVLGYRRRDVAHPCSGFGVLIPKIEGFDILGTIFSSSLFPNRAPADHITLTSYIGGERNSTLASLPSEELFDLTHRALRTLLSIRGSPTFRHHSFYPKAIPQYNVGYDRYNRLMNEIEDKTQNLFFAGNYRHGISVGDSIVSACNISERIEKSLIPIQSFGS